MKLSYFRYRFPFTQPFRTGTGSYNKREGFFLHLEKEGYTALGEAAPLPGFSTETPGQVHRQLARHAPEIEQLFREGPEPEDIHTFCQNQNLAPSLCFALDMLAAAWAARSAGRPLQSMLFENPLTSIPVNAVIPVVSLSETLQLVERYSAEGFRTFKFKAGKNPDDTIRVWARIREKFPDIILRMDANRSWSFDKALFHLEKLEKLAIEYCEEPLMNPTPANLEKLAAKTPVPLAVDETLAEPGMPEALASFIPVFIIKPMIAGSFKHMFATKRLADAHGTKVIFTTALESGAGRYMTTILAAGLGSHSTAHGLATGTYLQLDVWRDAMYINNGYFTLPGDTGANVINHSDLNHLAEEIRYARER